jgi:hypothetical protein
MARTRATENVRSRSKTGLIEEITRGIDQFQNIVTSIEDFSREGFPYREAARAKAELQFRECVRRIFGERSPEFQMHRDYRLGTASQEDTAQSLAVVKALINTLEDKKCELQGVKAAAREVSESPAIPPPLALVPPAVQMPSITPPAGSASPMAVSANPVQAPPAPASAESMPAAKTECAAQTAPTPPPSAVQAGLVKPSTVTMLQEEPQAGLREPPSIAVSGHGSAPLTSPPLLVRATPVFQPCSASDRPEPMAGSPASPSTGSSPATHDSQGSSFLAPVSPPPSVSSGQDPLESLRKVCLRFHAVTRQLRLRKDYRATLEVEDDYDLQDLLCALLKMEFEEVGTDEWTPPYTNGAPRTTFLLHGDEIAVSAKKTRPGLTTKELMEQVTADSARYSVRHPCHTLFCFIYDPEGRIGSPKRLETDLTSVSDRYMIEVLVAPK